MKKTNRNQKKYVEVSSKSYGSDLKGTKIYFEGQRPTGLKDDGSIKFGKNILEILRQKFKRFRWILTKSKNEIKCINGVYEIRTSQKILSKMNSLSFDRTRDIKIDIIKDTFSVTYPKYFFQNISSSFSDYKPGGLSQIINSAIIRNLSSADKDALNDFIPEYLSSEALSSISVIKATTQIKTLSALVQEIKTEIKANRSENWWQDYIQKNILFIQQGYIHAIQKMNVSIGNTKFPDFSIVTHDGFLDILEIKKPSEQLLKYDEGRENYYWGNEVSKAIIQIENYIENVSKHSDSIRSFIKDKHKIDLKVIRPRGILLVGDGSIIRDQKQKDDFRLLSLASRNISFLTYDELATRLENYISVLSKHSKKHQSKTRKS